MSVQNSAGRKVASGAIMAMSLLAPFLTTVPAHAAPCAGKTGGFGCNPRTSKTVPSGGGGGSGGGSGGSSGPVAPPPPEGLNPNQGVGVAPVPGGNAPPAPAPANTQQLVEEALSTRMLPVPTVHTAPKGKTYVRVKTALWVDGFRVVKTDPVTAGAQTVQATASPVAVLWNLGEATRTCKNAGSEDGKACNYTYRRSSARETGGAYQITATIKWDITWTCEGADCQGNNGTLPQQPTTSPLTPLTVGEIQTTTSQ